MAGLPSFDVYKVCDPVISEISSRAEFGVEDGPAANTYVTSQVTSNSNSVLTFNAQIPSQNVIVDRQVLVNVPLQFHVVYSAAAIGETCKFRYGATDSFQAFPFNSLLTSVQATINNTTLSNEVNYSLPAMLRLNNTRELLRYNSITPDFPDSMYYDFPDAANANNNPLAGMSNASYDVDQSPRGAFPVKISMVHTNAAGVVYNDQSLVAAAVGDKWYFNISAVVTEPIFCSPFIWSGLHDNQSMGFLGINTIGLSMNVDTGLRRLWSSQNPGGQYVGVYAGVAGGAAAAAISITDQSLFKSSGPYALVGGGAQPQLLLRYLSTQPSQILDVKNVIPYMAMEAKITQSTAAAFPPYDYSLGPLAAAPIRSISSNTFTLNQVPDKILVFVQKKWTDKSALDSNSWFKIRDIKISFNNSAGILVGASDKDLWRMSSSNGGNQNWLEWQGCAAHASASLAAAGSTYAGDFKEKLMGTTGSVLVLDPTMNFGLPDYLSASSMGQYQFQIDVSCQYQGSAAGDITPELVCLFINSGMLVTEMGMSSVYNGLLDKSLVLNAKDQKESIKYANRVVGGSLVERGLSVARKAMAENPELTKAVKSAAKSKLDKFLS